MTPEDKAQAINVLLSERMYRLGEELIIEWHEDIFICPSCQRCFVLGNGIMAGGDVLEGKAGGPSETVCRGCAKNDSL